MMSFFFNTRGPELPIHRWYDQNGNRVGEQLWPMKRWNLSHAGWDFNPDGFQHIGLLPDLLQDMRNVGVQWEKLGPLFRGAQDFIAMWQRSVAIGSHHPSLYVTLSVNKLEVRRPDTQR